MNKDSYPKVLIAIPIFDMKDYIFKENFEAIKKINYPNYDYVYIDNSNGTSYIKTLRKRRVKSVHVPRGGNSRQAICNSQNYARKRMLEENYDYLMFIESDLIPTPDCITTLMNHGVGVAGALYWIGNDVKLPCVFFKDYKEETNQMGTRLIKPQELKSFMYTGLRKVHGMGLGCTLIRRDIIKRFPFWYDERFNNKHSDVYFYMELENNQIPVYVDTNYEIKHYPSKWSLVDDK